MNNKIQETQQDLIEYLSKREKFKQSELRNFTCPYPITLFGENNDSVGGKSLSTTLDIFSYLLFIPTQTPEVRLYCREIPGVFKFYLHNIGVAVRGEWLNFVKGAASVLREKFNIQNGFTAVISIPFADSIFAKQSIVQLSSLISLGYSNDLNLKVSDYIDLCEDIDKYFLKTNLINLDPVTIKHAKKRNLQLVDFDRNKLRLIKNRGDPKTYDFITLRLKEPQTFNTKKHDDFKKTALLLGMMCGIKDCETISRIPIELYENQKSKLPVELQKIAENFFSEQKKIFHAAKAWEQNDLHGFGKLMNESTNTLVQYENCDYRIRFLLEKFKKIEGIYGTLLTPNIQIVLLINSTFSENIMDKIKSTCGEKNIEEIEIKVADISSGIRFN